MKAVCKTPLAGASKIGTAVGSLGERQSVRRAGTWAVIALKSADAAKTRLRHLLSDAERRELFFIMARIVIGALRATPAIHRVFVVTSCSYVDQFARQQGAEVILQAVEAGTAAAFEHSVAHLRGGAAGGPPARLLMLAGDLPLLSPAALSPLLGMCLERREVAVVGDRRHLGTNALLCSPPEAIAPRFGADSFRRHVTAARDAGMTLNVLESDELSLDIDGALDLAALRACYGNGAGPAVDVALRDWLVRVGSRPLMDAMRECHVQLF